MPLMHDSDKAWQEFGKTEPYFAVCTEPQYRNENLSEAARERFFQSGDEHVQTLLKIVQEQLVPNFQPTAALDFGCGVGRLVIPLARQCRHVVGVDVSAAMLDEARRNCGQRGLDNVGFHERLDQIPPKVRFDLVHTFIVLQHIPPSRGLAIFSDLVERIADGGVGVLHVAYWREAPTARKLVNWLRRWIPLFHNLLNVLQGWPFARPFMQMNEYSMNAVLRLLQRNNCHNVLMRFTDHGGHYGVVLLFQKGQRTDFT